MELCLDLGIRNTGWSVFRDGYLIDFGVWKTLPVKEVDGQISIQAAKDAFVIACGMKMAFYDYPEINRVIAELPGGSKSAKAAALMKMATGLAIGMCTAHDIMIDWISPRNVKQYALGDPHATKKKIIMWARRKHEAWLPKPFPKSAGEMEHIADSMAVYYAYKQLHGESLCEEKNQSLGPVSGAGITTRKEEVRGGRFFIASVRDQDEGYPRIMGNKVVSGMGKGKGILLSKTS